MTLEESVNSYGQKQIINNFDKIIKIDGRFIQVRLIQTKLWEQKNLPDGKFTKPMPRAKFIKFPVLGQPDDFYYLVSKKDLLEMKKK